MTIRVAIKHKTAYRFNKPVVLDPHVFRLRPAVHSRTPIEAYSFNIKPAKHFINWQQDPFGNFLARIVFPEPVKELEIDARLLVDRMHSPQLTIMTPRILVTHKLPEFIPIVARHT